MGAWHILSAMQRYKWRPRSVNIATLDKQIVVLSTSAKWRVPGMTLTSV